VFRKAMMDDRGDRKKVLKNFWKLGKSDYLCSRKKSESVLREIGKSKRVDERKKLKKLLENQKSFLTLPARLKPVPDKAQRPKGRLREYILKN